MESIQIMETFLCLVDKIYAQVENWISCIQYNLSEEIVLLAEKPI